MHVSILFPATDIQDIEKTIQFEGAPVTIISKTVEDENIVELTLGVNTVFDIYMLGKMSGMNWLLRQNHELARDIKDLQQAIAKMTELKKGHS